MASSLVVLLLAGLAAVFAPSGVAEATSNKLNLLPLPAEYTVGDGVVCLGAQFNVKFEMMFGDLPDDLVQAADRMVDRMKKSRHRFLSPTHGSEFFVEGGCTKTIGSLVIAVASTGSIFSHAARPVERRAEHDAYQLTVPLGGTARASAFSALGGFRALTSFENLWFTTNVGPDVRSADDQTTLMDHSEAVTTYAPFAPYYIKDRSAFAWRALLLDTSRHYFAMDIILKMLDAMASVKLNVFHWQVWWWLPFAYPRHITDSNSWPLELKAHPELAEKGSSSRFQRYSEEDVRLIVQ